ncbi:MAG: hypothetical protein J6I56_07000 [Lachnospiraceae bacterium]|nr:hypothetical protein [Lachnospiraceae bacterium]
MTPEKTVFVRFCGGCNPRFDRNACLRELIQAFPDIRFLPGSAENGQALLLICGCERMCLKNSAPAATRFEIFDKDSFASVFDDLSNL